jgi:hypothetical protein
LTIKSIILDEYASKMGLKDSSNFARDYKKKRDLCLDSIKSWDLTGIANVSIVVRQLRGDSDYDNVALALASV